MDDWKIEKVRSWPTEALALLHRHGRCDTTNYRDHHAGRCDCGWRRDGSAQRGWSWYISEELAQRHALPVDPNEKRGSYRGP